MICSQRYLVTLYCLIRQCFTFVFIYETNDQAKTRSYECIPYANLKRFYIGIQELHLADSYAAYLNNLSDHTSNYGKDMFLCNCTKLGTFGKFCEYYFMSNSTFQETIEYQFSVKRLQNFGSQYVGNRTCYKTLECDFGLLCLDSRNICDGKQQYIDGLDEDHCELLEYNECQPNEYRCVNGQCIEIEWICDGEWDCADASDEEGFLAITNLSSRNSKILNFKEIKLKCEAKYEILPFSNLCTKFQYPCLLANVKDPFNFNANPPCISMTQIGDGHCIPYGEQWTHRCLHGEDKTLYFYLKNNSKIRCNGNPVDPAYSYPDVHCLNGTCIPDARWNGKSECPYGEDEYYCRSIILLLRRYLGGKRPHMNIEAWICDRGVAIKQQIDELSNSIIQCFCPSSYFGRFCQYFSDRITVITRLEGLKYVCRNSEELSKVTIKILAVLIHNDSEIVDHNEIHFTPSLNDLNEKRKFYLIY
ncbi:unnamed protein product [Adineta ricciae]|uniref:Uncharacterized protein n=1 Tax=Adineta ricciae TaxID=249248 RepID=A0A814YUT2_ADIRI|nr:unnamed protein product [Adineta ricciae]CAF1311677.1 unnamed protein product [Adineta ricciae]